MSFEDYDEELVEELLEEEFYDPPYYPTEADLTWMTEEEYWDWIQEEEEREALMDSMDDYGIIY